MFTVKFSGGGTYVLQHNHGCTLFDQIAEMTGHEINTTCNKKYDVSLDEMKKYRLDSDSDEEDPSNKLDADKPGAEKEKPGEKPGDDLAENVDLVDQPNSLLINLDGNFEQTFLHIMNKTVPDNILNPDVKLAFRQQVAYFGANLDLKIRKNISKQCIKHVVKFYERHLDKVAWYSMSKNGPLIEKIFAKRIDKINWHGISQMPVIKEEILIQYMDKLCTNCMFRSNTYYKKPLSVEFIKQYMSIYGKSVNPICFTKYYGTTEELLELFPNKVQWSSIHENRNISVKFMEKHITKARTVGNHRNVTEEFIEKHYDVLDKAYISQNHRLPESFFEKHLRTLNWFHVSTNKGLSEEFFERHIDLVDWRSICENTNISTTFYEKYIDKVNTYESNWIKLCLRNLPIEFFERHNNKVDWKALCQNQHIPESFWNKHPKKIYWYDLCRYSKLSDEFLERCIDKIDWGALSSNGYISEAFFDKYTDKLKWDLVSENQAMSPEFFERHIDKINWSKLCGNQMIWYYRRMSKLD